MTTAPFPTQLPSPFRLDSDTAHLGSGPCAGQPCSGANLLTLSGPPYLLHPPRGWLPYSAHIIALRTELFRKRREGKEDVHSLLTFLKNSKKSFCDPWWAFVRVCVVTVFVLRGAVSSIQIGHMSPVPGLKAWGSHYWFYSIQHCSSLYGHGLLTVYSGYQQYFQAENYYLGNHCSFFYSES